MKKVTVVLVAVVLGASISAFACAGCGGCSLNGNGGEGCYGFQGGNGSCSSMMYSTASCIQSAAYRCCAGILDFFKGSAGAAPGSNRAQTY